MQTKEIGYGIHADMDTATRLTDTDAGPLMTAKQVINGATDHDCDVVFVDANAGGYLCEPDKNTEHGVDAHNVWLADMGISPEQYVALTSGLRLN